MATISAWQDIARAAGVIDARGHWAGGKTILVQLGDITDRGPDSLKIVRSLQQLQKRSAAQGRQGDRRPRQSRGDEPARRQPLHDAGRICRLRRRRSRPRAATASTKPIARSSRPPRTAQDPKADARPGPRRVDGRASARLGRAQARLGPVGRARQMGDAPTRRSSRSAAPCSSHGGISAEYAKLPLDDDQPARRRGDGRGRRQPELGPDRSARPLWYRGLVDADADAQAARAAAKPPAAAAHRRSGARRACSPPTARSGWSSRHTPSLKGIQITSGGRLARIDTGNSRYYGGPLSWLEIIGDQMIPHTVPRSP